MKAIESTLFVPVIPPGVIKDNASYVSNVIDTAMAGGAKSLIIPIQLGATDIAMNTLRVRQSETKTDANTLGGTVTTLLDILATVVPSATDDNKIIVVEIDLKQPHGRYLYLDAKPGTGTAGTYLAACGFFTEVGVPATDLGALAFVRG